MNKVLTAIGKGASVLLPILLVVDVSIGLYDRFKERHQNKPTPTIDSEEEPTPENE